jgi:hypothetical protein
VNWPRLNTPDHPEYGAQLLLDTSARPIVLVIWTDHASSLGSIAADGWTSVRWSGSLDELAVALELQGLPAAEASTLAAEVTAEWKRRWEAREATIRWSPFEVLLYATTIVVTVPMLIGAAVFLTKLPRALRLLWPSG